MLPSRWIITGGGGFLGTNILHHLKKEDGEVVVISRHLPRWPVDRAGIRYVEQDVREVEAFEEELTPGSCVIHLASNTYPGKAEKAIESDIQDNVLTTIRLAQACAKRGVRRFVFLSSGGTIYGPQSSIPIPENVILMPVSAYGVMKMTIEHYLRILHALHGLPVTCLRVGNPFGPWHKGHGQGAVNVFLQSLFRNQPIEIWGDGSQVRDYIAVGDVASAVRAAAMDDGVGYEVFNVGSGTGRSLQDVLAALTQVTGKKPEVLVREARQVDVPINVLDCRRIQERLGWKPEIPFEEGLRQTWEWVQKYG